MKLLQKTNNLIIHGLAIHNSFDMFAGSYVFSIFSQHGRYCYSCGLSNFDQHRHYCDSNDNVDLDVDSERFTFDSESEESEGNTEPDTKPSGKVFGKGKTKPNTKSLRKVNGKGKTKPKTKPITQPVPIQLTRKELQLLTKYATKAEKLLLSIQLVLNNIKTK